MNFTFERGTTRFPTDAVRSYIHDLGASLRVSPEAAVEMADGNGDVLTTTDSEVDSSVFWPFARLAYEKRLIDLIPANSLPSVNYDLAKGILLARSPFGVDADFSRLILDQKPVTIAGHLVDFPLGVPASILTTNASFIRYYAERGYPILTYKTVRSRSHSGNEFPQWVCLEKPAQFEADQSGELVRLPTFMGRKDFFPSDPHEGAMANSFGVPSHDPTWWQNDLAQARAYVREGHQLLIVSVMSSVGGDAAFDAVDDDTKLSMIADDFAETARLASRAGADVIELNFSCPNTKGVNRAGLIYQYPKDAATVSQRVRDALGGSAKIFAKIGYLNDQRLRDFVHSNWRLLDGIAAINTISAPVAVPDKTQLFPGRPDNTAGISGWSVRRVAHRLASQLVAVRDEIYKSEGKRLDVLGLGGVMNKQDFLARLATGVDAVEICTGGYFNPFLGLEIRNATGKIAVGSTVRSSIATTNGMMEAPQPAADGAKSRSGRSGAGIRSTIGGETVSRKSVKKPTGALQSGAIGSDKLRAAFKGYFKKQTSEEIVNGLNKRSPELLVHLNSKRTKRTHRK